MTDEPRYPCDLDAEWVAVDWHGRIGIFTTAGFGPMPRAQLLRWDEFEDLAQELVAGPETSECELRCTAPRPDDFVNFARHGCFSYDWVWSSRKGRDYRLQAIPKTPLTLRSREWSGRMRLLLAACWSPRLDFDEPSIDVREAFACVAPSR